MSELSVLNVENLSVGFISDGQSSSAVNGVSFHIKHGETVGLVGDCLLYTSPSPRDGLLSRMPSSA